MLLVHPNSNSAKRDKVCHLRFVPTYGATMVVDKEESTGMVDEKVTVISSVINVHMPRW
jgi:hypothetical protein